MSACAAGLGSGHRFCTGTGDVLGVGKLETEYLCVEGQFGVQCSANVGRLPEPVLFTLERHVSHRHTLGTQRVDDHLGLVGWHHLVLEALQHDQRSVEAVDVVDR